MKDNKIPVSQEIKKTFINRHLVDDTPYCDSPGYVLRWGQVLGGTDVGEKNRNNPVDA